MTKKRTKYRVFGGYKEAAKIAAMITAYHLRDISASANWLQDCMRANGLPITEENVEKCCRVAKALGFYAVIRRGKWIFGSTPFEVEK